MKQYVVDAFANRPFEGNPAAVCVLDEWVDDSLMQSIAQENRLSETAFTVREGDAWHLRWFTPGGEIDLCGHATLATAFTLSGFYGQQGRIEFETMGGHLSVVRKGDVLEMDFPAYDLRPVDVTDAMEQALGVRPVEAYMGRDLLCVLESERDVRELSPDQGLLLGLDGALCHVTAAGESGASGASGEGDASGAFDCVSRSFAPKLAIAEDPVCGSGHCHIFPYWASRLGKSELIGYQASERGGVVYGRVMDGRVTLGGRAALYAESTLHV